MSLRWNKQGIPHKGWKYVDLDDVEDNYEECEMCGKERIRYVHILEHSEYGTIRVGCICAANMVDSYVNPKEIERQFKNLANRRKNFIKQEWILKPSGNYSIKYKGKWVTVVKSKYGSNYGVVHNGEFLWRYKNRKIFNLELAKKAVFELFDYDISDYGIRGQCYGKS